MQTNLVEVVLYARVMQTQVEFYRDVLGLPVKFPPNCDDFRREYRVTFDTGCCVLALQSGGARRIGEGLTHIIFNVEDIQATRARLLDNGVRIGPIRQMDLTTLVCDGEDPEGNPFSIECRE